MQLLEPCGLCKGKTSPSTAPQPTYYDVAARDWKRGFCPECEGTGKTVTEEGKQVIELQQWLYATSIRRM